MYCQYFCRLSASKISRPKYNDGFITKWRPITTFGYRNDFDPKIQKEKRKLARMLKKEISAYKGPVKDIETSIRYANNNLRLELLIIFFFS